ncbi:type I-E CRISPR-associated protein Cas6/Cse3/CasE [Deinococcus soli (ex Cha et al. 2016)]|uniref:CRISPR system Cascade subunit CasE n=2 Tax=Deinococcus soli (ex Cha et al. 2016) TaxID=1309411 RepID=A0AAE3XED8_9DEIO|nr:type I-E CRISPR-associated protein Cas6/Cse3/CasE [Deinococcus soli (ex Cha et al. 2016)]MDR6218994.1 CRISPR system Cascade subunit CasE [Deinococcus soli (ex Cha et al. 2016)]MDR6328791.1 CRISPR system Cascade subunit CasE [Deinococcus soli (ex Cha et al. 2016)]MDR6751722.1 CRISPR system Cascade subunit CasE [Deinococcus soli (ex Cha et al. 2016)]
MILTQVTLNDRHARTRAMLGNHYLLHQLLSTCLEGRAAPSGRAYQWVLEDDDLTMRPRVLLLTDQAVDAAAFDQAAPGCVLDVRARPYRLPEQVHAGDTLAFKVRANTTRNTYPNATPDRRGRPKRVALLATDEQRTWLKRTGTRAGFTVLSADVLRSEPLPLRKQGVTMCVHAVTFTGQLRVTDPAALQNAVRRGLGPAKGFGLGLLLLSFGARSACE